MNINTQILLTEGEQFPLASDDAATKILAALGGDEATDTCSVQIIAPPATVGNLSVTGIPPE